MEREEFVDYFAGRAPVLRRVAFVIVRDWHAAEDVTQNAFAKVFSRWRWIRPSTVDAYTRKAVVNESLRWLSRRRDIPVAETDDIAVPPPEPGGDLKGALAQLPPRQRAVVALRFLEDLSVADTASVLGISEGTVKSHTARALASLRSQLTPTSNQESR